MSHGDLPPTTSARPGLRRGPIYRLLWLFFRSLLLVGWRMRVIGLEHLPPRGPYIMTPNHPSEVDPVVLSTALPFRPTYLAGRELERYPVIFAILRMFDPVFVRRGLSDVGAIKACLERLRRGEILVVFPEGGVVQHNSPGTLHPGAAFLAVRAGVPIVPVVLRGVSKMWPLGARWPRPSRVLIRFGAPIWPPASNGQGARELTETIGRTLRQLLAEDSAAAPP